MKSENIKKLTNEAIEQLQRTLDAGHSETLKLYLLAMARFRAYSMLNILLILKQCPRARRVAVWDETQTNGKPLPEIGQVAGDPSEHLARLESFVLASGTVLEYSDRIAPARGMAQQGKITLLVDLPPAAAFATLVHEQAHLMLHQSDRRGETVNDEVPGIA